MHSTNPSREAAKEAIALPQTLPTAIVPEGDIPRDRTASAQSSSTHLFRLTFWESNEVN
ncbi:hypothetical protein [Nostoc sp. ChiQUE01b]|uniref:hypothetical protein n=1 Tax=Nostoc sp. ChiQUE01b TaxID=3075376 RepID=UPI002AD205D7|nr:hypothetical protein [Nostoc sp. ChiQUE01b]MDZ8263321.1 hypothetical protein [Nostoc sp. ChiQUE01b]